MVSGTLRRRTVHVRKFDRILATLILLEPELDANYAAVKAAAYAWPEK